MAGGLMQQQQQHGGEGRRCNVVVIKIWWDVSDGFKLYFVTYYNHKKGRKEEKTFSEEKKYECVCGNIKSSLSIKGI